VFVSFAKRSRETSFLRKNRSRKTKKILRRMANKRILEVSWQWLALLLDFVFPPPSELYKLWNQHQQQEDMFTDVPKEISHSNLTK